MSVNRLVVLRGPSGAGKSTVARHLFDGSRRAVLIEQDHYRFIFNVREGEAYSRSVRAMIRDNVLTALANGFDVILEGVLKAKGYREIFAEIVAAHPGPHYFFYFEVSFEETLRRHRGRNTVGLFTEEDMRSWYKAADLLGLAGERVIPEESSAAETVALIRTLGW